MEDTPNSSSLKTSPEYCPAEGMDAIIKPCLKRSQKIKFQCLNLDAGPTPEWSEAEDLISLGSSRTPANISECHSDGEDCFLSAILQDQASVPQKYSLSPRACQGILRRAKQRGKELPLMLKAALEAQAENQQPE